MKRKTFFDNSRWKDAVERADNRWRKALRLPTPQRTLYESLTADDLVTLTRRYGPVAVEQYIKEMEANDGADQK